ncbi:hypothetical protein GCM10008968_30270 [Bacillus horti]
MSNSNVAIRMKATIPEIVIAFLLDARVCILQRVYKNRLKPIKTSSTIKAATG